LAFAISLSAFAADEVEPGLVGEYFIFGSEIDDFPEIKPGTKPSYVRVDKLVEFGNGTGDAFDIRAEDHFYARWTGVLRTEKSGSHDFTLESDDGSRMYIDGKLVVDNGGVHGFDAKSGSVDLKPGDHVIKIEFFEAGGGAGCVVSWKAPGGKDEILPAKALFHKKGADDIAWDKTAWEARAKGNAPAAKATAAKAKAPPPKSKDKMDYGLFHTAHVEANGQKVLKGFAIKLTKATTQAPLEEGQVAPKMAAVCFESERLCTTAAWTGGYLRMPTGRDGLEGHPVAEGKLSFGVGKGSIGWAKGDEFKDPREKPYGPLPRDWARYKGLYINGERTILSYTVGDAAVLESPGFVEKEGQDIFTRSFSIAKSATSLNMLVCEQDKAGGGLASGGTISADKVGAVDGKLAVLETKDGVIAASVSGAPAGSTWQVENGRIQLKLPAITAPSNMTLAIWSGPKDDLAKFGAAAKTVEAAGDLTALTKGGAPRWTPAITVAGTLGADDKNGYTADEITVPYQNPWNAYMRITGFDFFADGRAAVCTMSGDVWLLSGLDAKLEKITWKRYATGLFQALGLKIVDDKIYISGRDQITRFHDLNNDGEADFYENFNNDGMCGNSYHEFSHDLHTDAEGNFYYVRGSNLGSNGTPHNGCMIKVSKDGSKSEVISVGYRAPNGMGVGPKGELTTGDNQGNWIPGSPINWIYPADSPLVNKGELSFSGFRLDHYPYTKTAPRTPPMCWIPYAWDNSCGGQVWAETDKWGPLNGHLLHMSYGKSTLFAVMQEKVGDYMQAAVIKFPLKFISGIMRARFSKLDGQLYTVGMRGWQTSAAKEGCVTRVRYTGKPIHMPVEFHITKTGADIKFAEPLDAASANDVQNYSCEAFSIIYTGDYGSPEFSVADSLAKGVKAQTYMPVDKKLMGTIKKAHDPWTVKSAKLQPDGKTVSLEISDLQPVTNMIIKYKIQSADGVELKQEIGSTINKIP